MKKPEQILREQVTQYLKLQYPTVFYKVDLESDVKLTVQAGARNKKLQKSRGWPDLFIAKPSLKFCGMFLELKVASPYLKCGGILKTSQHLKEQGEMIWQLRKLGYWADFGIGFDDCKRKIDAYLKCKT